MALQGYNASIKVQSSGVAMTDEATTTGDNISYQITDTAKRYIDRNTVVVVEDGGVPTTENFSIDYLNGTITFTSSGTRTITVTGAYMTPATVATAMEYELTMTNETLENTPFESGFKTFLGGLVTGTASLGRYHITDGLFFDELSNGSYLIVELYQSATAKVSFYALVNTDNIESPVESLISESIDLQINNRIEV